MHLPLFSEVSTVEQWQDYVSVLGKTSAQDFKYALLSADEIELLRRVPDGILLKMQAQDPLALDQMVLMEVLGVAPMGASSPGHEPGWWLFFNPEAVDGGTRALHFWIKNASTDLEKELVPDLIHLVRNAQILGISARRLRSKSRGRK